MKEKLRAHRKLIDVFIILLVCFFFIIPMFKNVDVYKDDGIQHIARAYGTRLEFENTIFPNVISSFTNGFGYSWNLFYGPSTAYAMALISLFTGNFINAYKVFAFICFALSGIAMYKFMYAVSKNNNTSLLASVLYLAFPYHLTDLYIRNALGEFVSFAFIPLVFLGLYNMFYTEDKTHYLVIGAVGLIITHNLSTLFVAVFAMFFVILNLIKLQDKQILKKFIMSIILILLLSSFYWVPFIETSLFTNYQVYQDGMMGTKEDFLNSRLNITQLFVTKNDGSFVFELGPHIIIMLALSLLGFRKIDDDKKELHLFCVISAVLSTLMATKIFPWGIFPKEIAMIQFAWRFLMMAGFFLSVVCALNVSVIIKKFNIKDVLVISIITIGYTCAFIGYVTYDDNIVDINNHNLGIMSGKEIETVAGTAKAEYLPVNAYENRFYIASRDSEVFTLQGKAIIINQKKENGKLEAKLETLDAEYTIFELPYIYYPGYKVTLDGRIQDYFETENGFIGIVMVANDNATLEVEYVGTQLMGVSLFISCITLIGMLGYGIKNRLKKPVTLEK